MKSTIVLTLKWLALSAFVVIGCNIAETIDFNFDFSGTRTIEFQYRTLPEDGGKDDENQKYLTGLQYIDSISHWVDNVSNFKIDTSDYEMAKVSYDFTAVGPVVKDQEKYNYFRKKMPEEFKWYFKDQPNTFKVINNNQVLWKAVNKNLDGLEYDKLKELQENLSGVTTASSFRFERKIKDVNPKIADIIIGMDRKSITSEVNFDDVLKFKRPNDVVITFE